MTSNETPNQNKTPNTKKRKFLQNLIGDANYEYKDGDVVWAKHKDFPWWPGQIEASQRLSNRSSSRVARVRWFGDFDDKVDSCPKTMILPFSDEHKERFIAEVQTDDENSFLDSIDQAKKSLDNPTEPKSNDPKTVKRKYTRKQKQNNDNSNHVDESNALDKEETDKSKKKNESKIETSNNVKTRSRRKSQIDEEKDKNENDNENQNEKENEKNENENENENKNANEKKTEDNDEKLWKQALETIKNSDLLTHVSPFVGLAYYGLIHKNQNTPNEAKQIISDIYDFNPTDIDGHLQNLANQMNKDANAEPSKKRRRRYKL